MKIKTREEQFAEIKELNEQDKISSFKKKKARQYIMSMYHEEINKHNQAADFLMKGLMSLEKCDEVQNETINVIAVLKALNTKHRFCRELI